MPPPLDIPMPANRRRPERGFSLLELLVVISIITVLATCLLSSMAAAQHTAHRAACANNLRQINFGLRMYCDESNDQTPTPAGRSARHPYSAYKDMMKSYLSLRGASSARDQLFACPADTFYYDYSKNLPAYVSQSYSAQPFSDFSSYVFNGGNAMARQGGTTRPGVTAVPLRAIKHPARTLLVLEAPALVPFSWHKPKWPKHPAYFLSFTRCNFIFSNAMNVLSFVDGHVSYQPIYWKPPARPDILACDYDPPPQYPYQWSAD